MNVWGPKGIVVGHGSWKCQKGCSKIFTKPDSLILHESRLWNHILLHHIVVYPASWLRRFSLLLFVGKTVKWCPLLIKAALQSLTSGLGVTSLQQQVYITWLSDAVVEHSYTTSLLWACQHAVLLWVGSPHRCAAWLSLGYVSRYGGVFTEKREKMRDRSHSQRAVPEWCCSAPSSTLSTPNEKFQTSSEVALESGNVFPPLLCPFFFFGQ